METLINRIKIDRYMKYDISKDNINYKVQVSDAKLKKGTILANLTLEKITPQEYVRDLAPLTVYELFCERRKEHFTCDKISTILDKKGILAKYTWKNNSLEKFVEELQSKIMIEDKANISRENIIYFFEEAHTHYMNYFR